jgi:signal transduction histidine kinase
MGARLGSARARQILLLALLALCIAQVGWWLYDQAAHTRRTRLATERRWELDLESARRMLELGMPPEELAQRLPHVQLVPAEGPESTGDAAPSAPDPAPRALVPAIDPAARAQLEGEGRSRLNQYAWEGGFFALVLLAGIGVLARALRQEAALRERQQSFLAALSHEFKSPLASLRLSVETVALRDPPREARARLLQRAIEDVDRLQSLAANVLDSAQIDEGRLRLAPERLALADAARSALDEHAERAGASGARIECRIAPELEILADPIAVRAVLRNLLDNACKSLAASKGGALVLHARERRGFVELTVEDGGIGFAPEEAEQLFEKYYQGAQLRTRERSGSGLGLYIVRRFAELEGGWVQAHSAGPGRGAAFTVAWRAAAENGA